MKILSYTFFIPAIAGIGIAYMCAKWYMYDPVVKGDIAMLCLGFIAIILSFISVLKFFEFRFKS